MRYQTITIGAALMAATLLAGGCGRVSESSAATPSTATPRTTTAVALYNEYMPVRHDEIAQLEMYGARHIPIDGKTLKGSRRLDAKALHVVSAFASELSG